MSNDKVYKVAFPQFFFHSLDILSDFSSYAIWRGHSIDYEPVQSLFISIQYVYTILINCSFDIRHEEYTQKQHIHTAPTNPPNHYINTYIFLSIISYKKLC